MQRWLRSQGFQVTKTLQSGMYVQASGTAAQVEQAFGTTLHNYSYEGATRAREHHAAVAAGRTPAAVTGAMAGVVGMDKGSTLKQPADTCPGRPPATATACSRARATSARRSPPTSRRRTGSISRTSVCGYGPQQYQSAYGESRL